MKFKKIFAVFAAVFLVSTVFSSSFVLALSFGSSSTTSVRQGPRPSFETHYSQEQRNTYWPVLGNEETCESRQDLMLQVPPAGCQPPVVRSDLLAEQDVPVFCQVDAVNINPLIDISQINNMRFTGQYPPEVAGSGFHPARAALRTHDILLGSPLVNNVGYVVLVLKRQPDESKLPDFVNVTLTAEVDYVSGNAYGIGRSEFILEPVSDANWAKEKLKQSFWNGRYFLRLENSDENFADVSVYQGDRKVITTRVNKGETSRKIYVPGMYCRAGLQISYDSYVAAEKKARIEVSSGNDVDSFDVYEGSSFLDNRCSISKININEDGETGKVSGSCKGKEFELVLKSTNLTGSGDGIVVDNKEFVVKEDKGEYKVEINVSEEDRKGSYVLDKNNSLFKTDGEWKLIFDFSGNYGESVKEKDMDWFSQIYQKLILFKQSQTEDFVGNATQGMQYFDAAIDSYEEVADSYSGEGEGAYGKEALVKAITLARLFGKDQTRTRLINKYLEIYPDGENVQSYLPELTRARDFDTSLAGEAIEFDDKARVIRLVSLDEPTKTASAEFSVEGKGTIIKKGETNSLMEGTEKRGEIKLDDVKTDRVEVSAYCMINGQNGSKVLSTTRKRYTLKDGEPVKDGICGLSVVLDDVNLESVAKIKLTPFAEGTKTETNLTVGVGIEKRAIKLTPNKVRDKIEELNKTIAKWEKITDKLGKVVSGMKGACFATAAVLTFKNFMTGLSGEALARQEVMNGDNGWRNRCKDMVANGEKGYATMDHCVTGEAGLIDAEVAKTTAGLNSVNGKIDQIQNNPEYITDSGIFGKSVDTEKVRLALAEEAKKSCQGVGTINMGSKNWRNADGSEVKDVSVSELLVQGNVENGLITTDALRSVMLNCELKKQGLTSGHQKNVDSRLMNIAENVNGQMVVNWEFEKAKEWEKQGYPSPSYVGGATQTEKAMTIIPITQKIRGETGFVNVTHIAVVSAAPATEKLGEGEAARFGGSYVLGLTGDSQRGIYNVKDVSKMGVVGSVGENNVSDFTTAYGIGNIRAVDRLTYRNKIVDSDKLCRYFENEPYRGMPAVVPFDNTNGWYAATRQNLPTFGGIGAFDASGRVTSFWLCNVGENGRIEFNTGYGDDLCQQVNLNTGQTLEMFPGLDQSKARDLILRAQRAIEDAARQYGNQYITVAGEQCKVGSPEVGIPGTACWEFMSPKDCHLLFNVCDPVICPPSRCNLGGKFPVADVVQTGIIGSVLLCLPNFREGIVIPVCLTGIHAGIEALVSIMKSYRDCLIEHLETGEMVGICDQVYSIYLCEFFWGQVASFVSVLIPKLVELAYGQGTRGGAEYLSVMSAWQNMENSVNYFTQSYAVNAMTAFQARNVEEIGTQFCKAFISAKAPTAFKSLIEPDSPPQFHAWFDQKTFTSATVPATAQYKVFYYIFAGNDQGVYFNVYLKNPPQSGYYSVTGTIPVASDFIAKGESASETKDFTAPEGYKELCVRINNDEECGFGQVSTSFAVDYLRDSWMKDEIANANIQSEKECVSGGRDVRSLVTPNVQAGVEEFVSPEIYNRGVVRICASKNPGLGTDPGRFVDMGYCDDPKIRCWVDEQSVENAISDSNIGVQNETLEVLKERSRQMLEASGDLFTEDEAEGYLQELGADLESLTVSETKEADAVLILEKADFVFEKLFWTHQKARLFLVKGDINAEVARAVWAGEFREKVADDVVVAPSRTVEEKKYGLREKNGISYLVIGTTETEIYFSNGTVYSNGTEIGTYEVDGKIVINNTKLNELKASDKNIISPVAIAILDDIDEKNYSDIEVGDVKVSGEVAGVMPKVEVKGRITGGPNGQFALSLKDGLGIVKKEFIFNHDVQTKVFFDDGKIKVERFYTNENPKEVGSYTNDNKKIFVDISGLVTVGDDEKPTWGERWVKSIVNFLIFNKDYNVLEKLRDGDYSYCSLGGKNCSEEYKESDVKLPEGGAFCDKCGWYCSKTECYGLGNCYFIPIGIGGRCYSCSEKACLDYNYEGANPKDLKKVCDEDKCKIPGGCGWNDNEKLCIGSSHNIIGEAMKVVPCKDGEERIKVDLNDGDNYGLSSEGKLQWFNETTGWVDVKTYGRGEEWTGKTNEDKEWVLQLESELKAYNAEYCVDEIFNPDNIILSFNKPSAELFFFYKEPSGKEDYANLLVGSDSKNLVDEDGEKVAVLSRKIAKRVDEGEPSERTLISLLVGDFSCIAVDPNKMNNKFYGNFTLSELEKFRILSGSNGFIFQSADGSCDNFNFS